MMHSTTSHNLVLKLKRMASGLAVAVFWLAVWQLAYESVAQEILLVSPVQAVLRLFSLLREVAFWRSVTATCLRVVTGFGAAMVLGTALAALSAYSRAVWRLTAPFMGMIRATPVASFIILVLVWVYTDRIPTLIAFLVVLPIFWGNLTSGLASVDRDLLEMARIFQLSRAKVLRYVYLPAEAPHFASACSAGLGLAWKSAVAAEVIARPALSVGRRINDAKVYLETADLFAWTMAVILLSLLIEVVAIQLLRRLTARLSGPRAEGGAKAHASHS